MIDRLHWGFVAGVVVLVIDAAVPLALAHRVATLRDEAAAAVATRADLTDLLSAYKDTETGQRGFMLTGRASFLEPYTTGRAVVARMLPELQQRFHDPQQRVRFAQLMEADRAEHAFQRLRIAQRSQDNWIDVEASEQGKRLMDRLRLTIADLSTTETLRSEALLQRVTVLQHWSSFSLIAITALDLLLFALLFRVMARSIRAERAASGALTTLNRELADEMALRNETLTRLQQQSERLNQVLHIQTGVAEARLDTDAFVQNLVQRMLAITPATGAAIEMLDGDEMVYTAASGSIAQFVGLRLSQNGSLSGLCVKTNEVMISHDTRVDTRVDRSAAAKVGAATMIVTPLVRAGKPVGVLKIVADQPHVFDDNAVQTLQLMAGALGAALGNQLQFQKNQALLRERNITLSTLKRELQRREEYEHKLLNQQATLHAITDAMPALVAFVDAQGYLRYCNSKYEKISGLPSARILGARLTDFIDDIHYREHQPHLERAFAGATAVYETSPVTSLGQRHHECHLIPQLDENDKPDGVYLIAWDITERKTQEIEWQSRASIDQLTGVLNRACFNEALTQALQRRARSDSTLALLYLDIDRFKQINDTHGHAAGDTLLQAFAHYLKQSVRLSDIVGRLGGDEFCIVLEDIQSQENAVAVAEKILRIARTPVMFDNDSLTISTSIGIALATQPPAPGHSELSNAPLIAAADAALYKAKQAGRDRYAIDCLAG